MKSGCENRLLFYMQKLAIFENQMSLEKIKMNLDTLVNSHQPKIIIIIIDHVLMTSFKN